MKKTTEIPVPTDFGKTDKTRKTLPADLSNKVVNNKDLPMTKQDFQDLSQSVLDGASKSLTSNVSDLFEQALKDAYSAGYENHDQDFEQWRTGLQARLDDLLKNVSAKERQASADHSQIVQLREMFTKLVISMNRNSDYLRELISLERQPLQLSGKDAVAAINEAAKKSIPELVSEDVTTIIQNAQYDVAQDKQDVAIMLKKTKQEVDQFTRALFATLALPLLGGVIAMIVPWTWLKLLVGVGGLVGGLIYGGIKE